MVTISFHISSHLQLNFNSECCPVLFLNTFLCMSLSQSFGQENTSSQVRGLKRHKQINCKVTIKVNVCSCTPEIQLTFAEENTKYQRNSMSQAASWRERTYNLDRDFSYICRLLCFKGSISSQAWNSFELTGSKIVNATAGIAHTRQIQNQAGFYLYCIYDLLN